MNRPSQRRSLNLNCDSFPTNCSSIYTVLLRLQSSIPENPVLTTFLSWEVSMSHTMCSEPSTWQQTRAEVILYAPKAVDAFWRLRSLARWVLLAFFSFDFRFSIGLAYWGGADELWRDMIGWWCSPEVVCTIGWRMLLAGGRVVLVTGLGELAGVEEHKESSKRLKSWL